MYPRGEIMHIERLELHNFRCFTDLDLACAPRTLIVGRNATGKSSCADALSWIITGRCRGLDAGGKGGLDLIRQAAGPGAEACGTLTFAEGRTITRTISEKGHSLEMCLNGKRIVGSAAKLQAVVYEQLGTDEGSVLAVIDGARLLTLPHTEAKALLLRWLQVRIPSDRLPPGWPARSGEALTLEEWDAIYQEAFTERTARKKALARLPATLKPPTPAVDVAALEAKLTALRLEDRTLGARRASLAGKREVLEDRRRRLQQEQHALAVACSVPEGSVVRLDQVRTQLAALPAQPDEGQALLDGAEAHARLQVLREQLQAVERQHGRKGGCVLGAAIPCETGKSHFHGEATRLRAEIAAYEQTVRVVAEERGARQQQQAARTTLETQVRQAERDCEAAAHTQVQLDKIKAALVSLDQELAALGDHATEVRALEEQIAAIRQRIQKGEAVVREAHDLRAAWQRYEETLAKRATVEQQVQEAETACQVLGPNGVRAAALTEALADFHWRLDTVLAPYGYTVRIQADPWLIAVNGIPARLLAASEALRVGVAFARAVAELTTLQLVVIDQGDLLDRQNRHLLSAIFAGWPGQMLMLATRDEAWTPEGLLPGMVAWRLGAPGTPPTGWGARTMPAATS